MNRSDYGSERYYSGIKNAYVDLLEMMNDEFYYSNPDRVKKHLETMIEFSDNMIKKYDGS